MKELGYSEDEIKAAEAEAPFAVPSTWQCFRASNISLPKGFLA